MLDTAEKAATRTGETNHDAQRHRPRSPGELMGRARPAVKIDLQRLLQAAGLPD